MGESFKKGERVRHATKTEWGIGEVLADETASELEILFEDVGRKLFDPAQAMFARVTGSDGDSDYLTGLVRHYHQRKANPAPPGSKNTSGFLSFAQASENFLSYFPAGFLDPAYEHDKKKNERGYKVAAHRLMCELLGEEVLRTLLQEGRFKEVSDRAKRVVAKTGLIVFYEQIWFSNGLNLEMHQQRFAESLFDLLYGHGQMQARFERFAETLESIGAAKWPIATYFPFIRFPEEHMFLKPMVTKEAAGVLGQELNYRPQLNWLTYSHVLALAQRIRNELEKDGREALKPRDMIDVQSFIWVTAPSYTL